MLDDTVTAYVECAIWAGLDWAPVDAGESNPRPLDENYGIEDLSEEARSEIVSDVASFLESNADDVATLESEQVGDDFYLTRNHHGAGFWDRGLGDVGDRLTEAAHGYGTSELYPGDDGKLYLSH